MKDLEKFLIQCFEQECTVHHAHRKVNNLEQYHAEFKKLNAFTVNDDPNVMSKIGFGLSELSEWHDEEFFEELDFLPEIRMRHLFKISEYMVNDEKIWLCYTSNSNPSDGVTKLLSHCFVVKNVNNELKIITQLIPDYDTKEWKKVGGFGLQYKELGMPVLVKRLIEPANDSWSLAEYRAER